MGNEPTALRPRRRNSRRHRAAHAQTRGSPLRRYRGSAEDVKLNAPNVHGCLGEPPEHQVHTYRTSEAYRTTKPRRCEREA
ncbi:Semaphorin-3C [Manis pentadactyla]|nr:Semaphorin-3C [Manis pentadactyla]